METSIHSVIEKSKELLTEQFENGIAPNKMDFPAPVSPVIIEKPWLNCTWRLSIKA